MINSTTNIPLRTAALIAGLAIFIMAIIAPFAELYVYPKLVIPGMAEETFKNISANKPLFIAALFSYVITCICDIIAAWALYVLLRPVNENLSLLTAWFRLVYTVIAIVALLNLVTVVRLLNTSDYLKVFKPDQLYAQVMLSLNTFRYGFHFAILFFAIHLLLSGYLVLKASFIPRIMGIFLIISGLGYLADTLKPFLFPEFDSGFVTVTYFGELIFMFWLLIKGTRIKDLALNSYAESNNL